MTNFLQIVIVLAMLFFVSCSHNEYTKEIATVEEMQTILTGVKQTYNQIEVDKVAYALETYEKNISEVKTHFKQDSIDLNTAKLLDFYEGVKKSAKGFEGDYSTIGVNIEFLDNQLNTLKQDMINDAEFNDSLAHFIQSEQKSLDLLRENIGTLVYNYDYVVNVHDSIASKVQQLLLKNVE